MHIHTYTYIHTFVIPMITLCFVLFYVRERKLFEIPFVAAGEGELAWREGEAPSGVCSFVETTKMSPRGAVLIKVCYSCSW